MQFAFIAASLSDYTGPVIGVLMAAAGLGFIIFVHELGHFAVARMCGVKCEKFMVGFDFWGLKLSRKWGETEYGIGVFPLGGYVKMLGQDDDPSKAAEQFEASRVDEANEFAKEVIGPDGQKRYVDRRSYQAKSVPQRMAIISAGVIMNIIFAFVFAVIAFGIGVEYPPCVISRTTPGLPAWQAGLEAGDEFVQIGDRKEPSFDHLRSGVSLADLEEGVDFRVRRAATGEVEKLTLKPEKHGGMAIIGVGGPTSNKLFEDQQGLDMLTKRSGLPSVTAGATITAIDGEPVSSYRDIVAALAARPDQDVDVTFELPVEKGKEEASATPETTTTTFPALRAKRLGLVMTMGPITAVQKGSPAEAAGLEAGDTITAVDGRAIGGEGIDPATLEKVISSDASVELTIVRKGAEEPEKVTVQPRPVNWIEEPMNAQGPMPLPSLGVAYEITPVVTAVTAGGPAEGAGVRPGDIVTAIQITPPANGDADEDAEPKPGKEIAIAPGKRHWPLTLTEIRSLPDGGRVKLELKRGDQSVETEMTPVAAEDEHLADHGLTPMLGPILRMREANSFSEQIAYGADRTWFSLTMVVRVIEKLISQQVPADQLGGPLMILESSYRVASVGLAQFLLFLTLISANLAVLNFLPIPVLDGGHMVFLAWEGITGKPANEKLMVVLQLIGIVLLLSLMIFVTRNDILRMMGG